VIEFDEIVGEASRKLRRALVARYGPEFGAEAHAAAIAYAWEHRERLVEMANPIGYLWRVAQTSVRRQRRWERQPVLPPERWSPTGSDEAAPLNDLAPALARLKPDVRVAVLMVHGYDWSYGEVAELLGVPVSTVRNHVHRGLSRLRTTLEVTE
jgi:RNA polymerase sigma factor (sigma-70 family)